MTGTERLKMAPLRHADADELLAALDDPVVGEYLGGPDVTTIDALHARIDRVRLGPPADRPDERWLNYVVRRTDDDVLVGRIEATTYGDWAEVAYVFGPAHWGNGYACEAMSWLVDDLMANRPVTQVWATVDPRNQRSRRLLERLGFTIDTEPQRRPASFEDGDLVYGLGHRFQH